MSRYARTSEENPIPFAAAVGSLSDPVVGSSLRDLLRNVDPNEDAFERGLRELDEKHGSVVYAELIHLLSDLEFEPGDARRHWELVRGRWHEMRRDLAHDIDVRVALMSYFLDVKPSLDHPKIIEFDRYERARDSAYRDEL
ncbi:MAG: hypothetical protein OER88_08545, partial [Planctomycetota bacterium]|nr:hypothetical protein [Planctomycetota bacterium]